MNDTKLTRRQIENWRNVLVGMIGPYALLMTDEQVQSMRDRYQGVVDATSKPSDSTTTEATDQITKVKS